MNHAECRRLRGRAALQELLSWDGGAFRFYAGDGGGPASESIRFEGLVLSPPPVRPTFPAAGS